MKLSPELIAAIWNTLTPAQRAAAVAGDSKRLLSEKDRECGIDFAGLDELFSCGCTDARYLDATVEIH
jgi:hypothetical protein